MNALLLTCFLFLACCSMGVTQTTVSEERSSVTSSGNGIQISSDEDVELEHEEDSREELPQVQRVSKPEEKGKSQRKGKGKRRHKNKGTPSDMPSNTPTHMTPHMRGEDPCATTHQDYCIHGQCKYMEDLGEPTCVCVKGYDGERCGIQLLKTEQKEQDPEVTQTVLVVIAVVLSLISCCAILLMICAHYRTHRNFLAAYLGTSSEKEKLQKNSGDMGV